MIRLVKWWAMSLLVVITMGLALPGWAEESEEEVPTAFLNNPEVVAQWNLNYGSFLMDEHQYLDALVYFETAFETSKLEKTRARALLYLATTFASFLNSPDSALKIYRQIQEEFPSFADAAFYQETLLLFETQSYHEVMSRIRRHGLTGRFRFQLELLHDQAKDVIRTAEFQKEEQRRMIAQRKAEEAVEKASTPTAWDEAFDLAMQSFSKIDEPTVRVLLSKSATSVKLSGSNLVLVIDGQHKSLRSGSTITVSGRVLSTSSMGKLKAESIEVISRSQPISVEYDKKKRRFHGRIYLKVNDGKIRLMNYVKMEAYLRSVVPAESYPSWEMDALKAQTLAARTYAYNEVRNHAKKYFDVYDDIRSQVYAGVDKEHKRTDQAIRETKGQVIAAIRKGKLQPILAMFAANSGGYTADPKKEYSSRWDSSHHYLHAHEDGWSTKAGKGGLAIWSYTHSAEEIAKNLRKRRINVNKLEDMQPEYVGPSGRVVKVRLTHDGGQKTVIPFRPKVTLGLAGRIGTLPDTITTIERKGDQFTFNGKGFGHGIGYMQSGGQYMAKAGNDYRKILSFYYPGTRVINYW
ncbi:MAG: SpoIID/LytB domain-containing protein [Magnetococcales bacterium]|nr:SpoIID/LytB domain-containing protein [Magnetococcales bacterium]